jgi:hypothetical protein
MPVQRIRLGPFNTAAQCDPALQKVNAKVAAEYEKERNAGRRMTQQIGDAGE